MPRVAWQPDAVKDDVTRELAHSMSNCMFTGLVEDTGTIDGLQERPSGQRLVIATRLDLSAQEGPSKAGDSIAVDGVCLTAVVVEGQRVAFDVGPETLAVTAFVHTLRRGRRVHLERALRLHDRLGGHMVAGHVDGVGRVVSVRPEGDAVIVRFSAPARVLDLCIFKGSIAVDGVSLTINSVNDDGFDVCLIPYTLTLTHLNDLRAGDFVNLETDLIGKYVQRLVTRGRGGAGAAETISWDLLKKSGFSS